MKLLEFIEKKMREKGLGLFSPHDQENKKQYYIKIPDAVDIAYGIMRDMGVPDDLDIEIEETE